MKNKESLGAFQNNEKQSFEMQRCKSLSRKQIIQQYIRRKVERRAEGSGRVKEIV
jgi:hypothetical protein